MSAPAESSPTRGRMVTLWPIMAVVAALVLSGGVAAAQASWNTFGSGYAVSRGGAYGAPDVGIESTTRANPDEVRFVVANRAGQARRVHVYWNLRCWKPGRFGPDTVTNKSADFRVRIGGNSSISRSPTFRNTAKFCELDVWVPGYSGDDFTKSGRLDVKLQATY